MQRLRVTDQGLQFTQDLDVVSFEADEGGNVEVRPKSSALHKGEHTSREFTVVGRDNIRVFGGWLKSIVALQPATEQAPSRLDTYAVDSYRRIAAASIPYGYLDDRDLHRITGTSGAEGMYVATDDVADAVDAARREPVRVEVEAFEYPLGIPDGMSPVLLATQTYDRLRLQFDDVLVHSALPMTAAHQLGEWVLNGVEEINNKSIWGA